jgi:ribosomal protein S10
LTRTYKAERLQLHAYNHENLKKVFNSLILWSYQKNAIYTLSMALPTHVNNHKEVKITVTAVVMQ